MPATIAAFLYVDVPAWLRYIEMNPVRAEMVTHPAEYRWSSGLASAQGPQDALIRLRPRYVAPGVDTASRELFRFELEPGLVDEIRRAANGNYVLGNARFSDEIAAAFGASSHAGTLLQTSKESLTDVRCGTSEN